MPRRIFCSDFESKALSGWTQCRTNNITFLSDCNVALHQPPTPNSIALISGGGSGHEPSHFGFVGKGMLTAAVCGKVFASPSSSQVFSAILATQSQNIILIVKNYTGDRLQFGKAAERARRELHAQNVRVEMLIVDDDCAIQNTKRVGRRGLCGTLFIHKILGWLSTTTSYDLDVMVGIGKNIINSTRTIGVALSSCTIPGQEPMFEMPSDSMELGLGIHGESGYLCTQRPSTSAEIVSACLDKLMQDQTLKLTRGDRVAVLLNNFGGCTMLEMGVLIADVLKDFGKIGAVVRLIPGSLMTSLEMVGFSISALKLENASTESLYIQGLDYPVPEVHAWPSNVFKLEQQTDNSSLTRKTITNATGKFNSKIPIKTENGRLFMRSVVAACRALFASESALNQLDKVAGDGDCGLSMCSGANKILSQIIIESPTLPSSSIIPFDLPHDALSCISLLLDDSMGGSSGALLMIFLDAASAKLQTAAVSGNGMEFNVSVWAQALEAGLEAVKFYGGAKVGDRSMVDVLEPAIRALTTISRNEEVYDPLLIRNSVGSAAVAGAESTKGLVAGVGRSSYLSESSLQGSIDPGAYAMQLVIEAILATTLKQ